MKYLKMGNLNRMLFITIAIGALALMTACSYLGNRGTNKHIPRLKDVNFGPNHEIQLISGYPDPTLFYVKTNKTYIVKTQLRTHESFGWENYWRISNSGELLDSFASGNFYFFSFAGVSFGENSYNDWPLTGDKRDKEYLKIIHSNEIDKKTLHKLLSNSEQILWNYFYCITHKSDTKEICYYLKNKNNWTLLVSK